MRILSASACGRWDIYDEEIPLDGAVPKIGPVTLTGRKMPATPFILGIAGGVILAALLIYDLQIALASLFLMALLMGSLVNRGKLFPYMVLVLFITGNLLPMDKRFFPESSLSFNLDAFLNVIVVVLSLIVLMLNHRQLRKAKNPALMLWLIFTGYAFLSLLLTNYPGYGLKTIVRLLAPFLIGLVFIIKTESEKDLRRFVGAFLLILTIPIGIGVLDLIGKFTSLYHGEFRLYSQVASVFNHRAAFGMFLVAVCNLSLVCVLRKKTRVHHLLLLLVSVTLVVFNNTRIVWLSFLVSLIVIFLLKRKFKLLILIIPLIALAYHMLPNLQFRLGSLDISNISSTYFSSPQFSTLRGRVLVWNDLLQHLNSALFGNGIGFVRFIFTKHSEWFYNLGSPHNEYLGMFMDMGGLGLALFIFFYIVIFIDLTRTSKKMEGLSKDIVIFASSLVVASLVFFTTDNLIGYYTINSLYWIFFGLGLSTKIIHQEHR
jgi:O-antigen ligase